MKRKSILTRDIPKPIVIGLVVFLLSGWVANLVVPALLKPSKEQPRKSVYTPKKPAVIPQNSTPRMPTSPREWVRTGTAEQFQTALAEDPGMLSHRDEDGWLLTHYCAATFRADLLEILLNNGASPDDFTNVRFTPLHIAMQVSLSRSFNDPVNFAGTVSTLLGGGASPDVCDPNGIAGSPAAWAASRDYEALVDVFVEYGGDPTLNTPNLPIVTVNIGDSYPNKDRELLDIGRGGERSLHSTNLIREYSRANGIRNGDFHPTLEGQVAILIIDENNDIGEILVWNTPDAFENGNAPASHDTVKIQAVEGLHENWWKKVRTSSDNLELLQGYLNNAQRHDVQEIRPLLHGP